MTEKRNTNNQNLSSERVHHSCSPLQRKNNTPKGDEAIEKWLSEHTPLDIPIWVTKKIE